MDEKRIGYNLIDFRKICTTYIDYTRTYMNQKLTKQTNKQHVTLENFVFQFSSKVTDFSSQYGSDISISYTASNLTGKPSKFPSYGDFPQSYVMRTYGQWKDLAPSRKCPIMSHNSGKIKSEDYIILSFEIPVIPLVISIFETYTPGSIVRILGKAIDVPETMAWKLLWEGMPQNCNNLKQSRLFTPKLKLIKERVKEICIEFNHSQLDYYTELDAVSMGGILIYPEDGDLEKLLIPLVNHESSEFVYDNNEDNQEILSNIIAPSISSNMSVSTSLDPFLRLIKNIEELENEWCKVPDADHIMRLPDETLMHIFSLLDLKSLRLCMRVCKRFNNIGKDTSFYRELNLKPYWSKFSYSMFTSFEPYCGRLSKLDLSWCGITNSIVSSVFNMFLKKCGTNLTHLRVDCCIFINDSTLITINLFCKHLKELSIRSCTSIDFELIYPPQPFPEMERIDFYRTYITQECLELYLVNMPKLMHLNLGSCKKIGSMDNIARVLSSCNKELVSVDFWKSYTLSPIGLRYLTILRKLEEIDLGWCLAMSIPGDSLLDLAKSCPRLKKIVVVSLRGLNDHDLLAFAHYCPLLEQIDLVGVRAITVDACSKFLQKCKHLKLMDVNFCENIKEIDVMDWRQKYPDVCIQFNSSENSSVFHY